MYQILKKINILQNLFELLTCPQKIMFLFTILSISSDPPFSARFTVITDQPRAGEVPHAGLW
jgi:hypothetical protein